MSTLTYIVTIHHANKGIGFNAKTALQNARKQNHSPIQSAVFAGTPTSSSTQIQVGIDDEPLCAIIAKAITASGRMSQRHGLYEIMNIALQEDTEDRMKSLRKQYMDSQKEVSRLCQDNEDLRQGVTQRTVVVGTALDGLLAYFEATKYVSDVILNDPADVSFARKVYSGESKNTFADYAHHVLGEHLSQDHIKRILSYKPKSPDQMSSLRLSYEAAKEEVDFLRKLQSGDTETPETLVAAYMSIIESKEPDKTIKIYEEVVEEEKSLTAQQTRLRALKHTYEGVSEKIDLLALEGQEVPVIFNHKQGCMDVYFPFRVRNLKPEFIDDLRKELETYFANASVEPLDNRFVAYSVAHGDDLAKGVDHLVERTPVTLLCRGFNKIIPYRLGV